MILLKGSIGSFGARSSVIEQMVDAAEERGIELFLSEDFEMLRSVHLSNKDSWPLFATSFDPGYGAVSPAFWVGGSAPDGRTVASRACRLYDLRGSNLWDALSSLRLWYGDPASQAGPGETLVSDEPEPMQHISGLVSLSGAGWHHPEFRGRGLSGLLARLAKQIGLFRWSPDRFISFVHSASAGKAADAYHAPRRLPQPFRWTGSATDQPRSLDLLVWTRDEVASDHL